ncbi:MAG TPA: NAD(P)/FAD-dependent oxidoreductase [Mycobacteriales bacterium]|nr:NAD(P)/FAD-dependent oxidoreductase [Mycobacteriales bacterium]
MTSTAELLGAEMDDVVIVGGRCAGAATAMLLARAGVSVRLVERARRLGDVVSGHLVKPAGAARLRRWGLLDDLLDGGTPPLRDRVLWADGEPLLVSGSAAELPALAPRRPVLDAVLLQAAADAGVTVELGAAVRGVIGKRGRVVGVATANGDRAARLVIGADGRNSRVARAVGADYTAYTPAATFAYYTYWRGTRVTQLHAWLEQHLFVGMFPTNDRKTLVFYQAPAALFEGARREPMRRYLNTLQARPPLRELLGDGVIDEPLKGIRDLPTFFRQSAGAGWALAGDAGHHKDPLIARGIADAFRDADLLAAATVAGWDTDLEAALGGYQAARDAVAAPLAAANAALATLAAPSCDLLRRWQEMTALEAALDPVEDPSPVPDEVRAS